MLPLGITFHSAMPCFYNLYLIPIKNVAVRYKVNYNMNAIQEPSEPMGGDLKIAFHTRCGSLSIAL